MGCGASKATTPAAGEGATGTGGTGGTGHANIARSGISGRGAGGHAPKAKTMSRTHFESKIGKVGFDKADVSSQSTFTLYPDFRSHMLPIYISHSQRLSDAMMAG